MNIRWSFDEFLNSSEPHSPIKYESSYIDTDYWTNHNQLNLLFIELLFIRMLVIALNMYADKMYRFIS